MNRILLLFFPFALCAAQDPCIREKSHFGNPTGHLCSDSLALEAAAELLILQPFEEGLDFAIRNDVRQTSGGDGTPGGPLLNLKTRWQPGWRVSLGYCPSVTARAVWTGFAASSLSKAKAGVTPVGIGLQSTWVPPVGTATLYQTAALRWNLDLNTIDLEVGKRYWVSPYLCLIPRGLYTPRRGGFCKGDERFSRVRPSFRNFLRVELFAWLGNLSKWRLLFALRTFFDPLWSYASIRALRCRCAF